MPSPKIKNQTTRREGFFRARSRSAWFVISFFLIVTAYFCFETGSVLAATGINKQISFQGKVVNTNGTNVANGSYDFVFKLYTVDSGGVAAWTETWNSGTSQVTVTDGIFQVNLGTHTALPGSIDFNTDNIYLGIEFNGDGEMSPRVHFTAAPYAFNAQKVGGLTVTDTTGTLTIPNGSTISFGGSFTTSASNDVTLTTSGSTNVTLPTTGTLTTLAGSETLTNKTIGSTGLTFSGAATDITTGTNESLVIIANGSGTVDIQDATNVDSLTTDTGGISIAAGQAYTGAGAVTLSSGGSSGLTIDSASGRVAVATGDFLSLSVAGVAGAAAGDIWYDSTANKFKINENGTTKILCNTTDLGCGSGGVTADSLDFIDFEDQLDLDASTDIKAPAGQAYVLSVTNEGSGNSFVVNDAASDTTPFLIDANGNVGIGDSTPDALLDFDFSSTSGTAGTEYGAYFTTSDTGAVSTGTDTTYGLRNDVTRTGATGGTLTTYGNYSSLTNTFASGSGVIIGYGDYLTVTGNTNGTSIITGSNVVATGADTTYGYNADVTVAANVSQSIGARFAIADATTSASTSYGQSVLITDTGVVTTGTDTNYGSNITVTRTGATGGTLNTYGTYTSLTNTFASGSGTANGYGNYVTVAGSTAGTNVIYGNYTTVTGFADFSYANYASLSPSAGSGAAGYAVIGTNTSASTFDGFSAALTQNNAGSNGRILYGTLTVTAGNGTGTQLALNNTDTTGATLYGDNISVIDTAIVTTGTDTNYGSNISVLRTGATGGTIDTYGQRITLSTDNAGSGTSTAYGSYIDTGVAGSTNADTIYGQYITTESNAGTAYGLYVDAGTGAGTEYAAAFLNGNVGIGDTTPDAVFDIDFSKTSGTLTQVAAPSGVTLDGNLTGQFMSLGSNVTATDFSVTAYLVGLPTVTNTGSGNYFQRGFVFGGGNTLTQSTAAGTTTYRGFSSANPNLVQTTGTAEAYGFYVSNGSNTTGGDQYGFYLAATGVGAGTLTGINLTGITGGAGTETAIAIGSGWDTILDTASIDISGTGAITGATGVSTTTVTASSAIAANGGITFDNSTDTVGAFTAAGMIDLNTNILTNIGNAGTDFVATTGALTLAGILTANGGISIGTQSLTGTTGIIDYTNFDVSAAGTVTLATGQAYTGAGAITLSSGGSSGLTLDSASGVTTIATGDYLALSHSGVSGAAAGYFWYDSSDNKFKINENGTTKVLCNTTDLGCGAGGGTTWDAIGDAAANGAIAMNEFAQTLDWNTAATAGAFDGLTITITNDATSDAATQRAFVVANLDDSSTTGTTETIAQIVNRDINETVGTGLLVENTGAGTMTDAIKILETAGTITTAINIGNNVTTGISIGTGVTTGILVQSGGIDATGSVVFTNTGTGLSFEVNDQSSDTTPFAIDQDGNVGIGTSSPNRILDIVQAAAAPQLRLSKDLTNYSEMTVDSVGDLQVSATGGDIRALTENIWVCDGGACPALTLTGQGNIFVENVLKFGNGVYLKNDSSTELGVYDSNDQAMLIFDQL